MMDNFFTGCICKKFDSDIEFSINEHKKQIINENTIQKMKSTFIPLCRQIEDIKQIHQITDLYEFQEIAFDIFTGIKTINNSYLIPFPFWISKKLEKMGPLLIKRLGKLKGLNQLDLLCDELELIINMISKGIIEIKPGKYEYSVKLNNEGYLRILEKNYNFFLTDGRRGEIDIILQCGSLIYLIEAKSLVRMILNSIVSG